MAAEQIQALYQSMAATLTRARQKFGRPLTLTEQILVAHAWDFERSAW